MENEKQLKMSEILKQDCYLILNAKAFKNPDDISKENCVLYTILCTQNDDIELDLNESIVRFNLPEAPEYWLFIDVIKIDHLEIVTKNNYTMNILYFMCKERGHNMLVTDDMCKERGYNMLVTDDELEEIYKKLRELNRYDILIKCQG